MSFLRYEDDYAELASALKWCLKQAGQSSLTQGMCPCRTYLIVFRFPVP